MSEDNPSIIHVGWREWVALPELSLPAIKAKVDTGAKTSALHAFYTEAYEDQGIKMVRFGIHPIRNKPELEIICQAPVKDLRQVTDSGGHREMRYVIETKMVIGQNHWPIELTLTNRDTMLFRMLLGRRAMEQRILVDPGASYRTGKLKPLSLYSLQTGIRA
ncbi:MAG: ATP-dependent zinc protease [Gammaproteobacteria bacterium]|nr:ATP-dependent zinc protease [Gammaproteobacteria bacterium]